MAELDARRAEVLSSAAKIIQQRRRTHIARKRFIALREASILLQSFCRGETLKTVELQQIMQCKESVRFTLSFKDVPLIFLNLCRLYIFLIFTSSLMVQNFNAVPLF